MRKPGRPKRIPQPEEFGQMLTIEEAGSCLGLSYQQMRRAVYDHNIPTLKFGRVQKISRAVINRILDAGEFSAGRKEDARDAGDDRKFTGRSALDAYLSRSVHGFAGNNGTGGRSAAVGGKA